MIAYKGYTWKESWVLNIAALGLLFVAFCPMDWTQPAIVAEDVAFSLEEGDSLALLGRNGMGKTTLLVTLMGLTRMRGGTLRWRRLSK